MRRSFGLWRLTMVASLAAALAAGCVVSTSPGGSGVGGYCSPGATSSCSCLSGATGSRTCAPTGAAFGSCTQGCACPGGVTGTLICDSPGAVCYCPGGTGAVCTPGQSRVCSCPDGTQGAQGCLSNGLGFGTCVCSTGACSLTAGQACSASAQCCAAGSGTPTLCVNFGAAGQVCAARCASNSDCANGCCATLSDGSRSCGPLEACTATCSRTYGQNCSADTDCCPDPATGRHAACTTFGGSATCWSTCTTGSDCASGCCTVRTDGVRTCGPASACTVVPACSRTYGQSCSMDTDCCPDPSTGRHAVCTDFGSGGTCWSTCTVGSDCASGCCTTRTDGVRSCGPAGSC